MCTSNKSFDLQLLGAKAEVDEAPHTKAAAAANKVLRLNIMVVEGVQWFRIIILWLLRRYEIVEKARFIAFWK
jgi:hypothetical protein